MKHTLIVTPAGEEMVLISKADFDRIEDALDSAAHDEAKARNAAGGGENLTQEEMLALLDAPSPLAFWRGKRGMTQVQLARAAEVSQSYVAGLESGARRGDPALFKRFAAVLRVRMEDIVAD
jgi:DNA-binding XRE family transcriptional regulator